MHDAEEVAVPLDFHRAGAPIHRALEGQRVADLNVEWRHVLREPVLLDQALHMNKQLLRWEQVHIFADKAVVEEKLQGCGAEHGDVRVRRRREQPG